MIASGSLFGTIGLVLAAPLTGPPVRISADLARSRAKAKASPARPTPEPEPRLGGMGRAAAPG